MLKNNNNLFNRDLSSLKIFYYNYYYKKYYNSQHKIYVMSYHII